MAGQNIVYNIIGAGLAYYLQFTILIPAIAVSVIMAVARVWDAFNDPIMGTIVDRTRTKWGKCKPYLMFVPSIIFVATVLCFVNFGIYGDGSKALDVVIVGWAAFSYILFGMTYTIGDIPLWSITALMTEDEKDRNKLLSLARIFGGIGGGVSMLCLQPVCLAIGQWLGNRIGDSAQGERYGFLIGATIFALIGCGLFQLCGFTVKERIPSSEKKYTLKDNFRIMWQNKPFRQILLSGILGSTRMLLALCAMPLVTYYYASKSAVLALVYMAILGGGMFVGMFVASGLTPLFLKKFSKKTLYNYSNLLGAIPYILMFILYHLFSDLTYVAPMIIAVILFIFAGASIGFANVLQSLMIADCVDYEEYTNGTRPDGVFFSGQTFIAKLTSGIATIISGIGYAIVGFSDTKVAEINAFISAGGIPRYAAEYDKYMAILFFLISIPPAIGCILAIIPTWHYALDDDVHQEIMNKLNEARHQVTKEN
jgi:sugar (glycoside-pentoside-hexuronide) transporter